MAGVRSTMPSPSLSPRPFDVDVAESVGALLGLLAAADRVVATAPPADAVRILRAVEDRLAALALIAKRQDVARRLLDARDELGGYVLAAVLVDEVTAAASCAAVSILRRGIASTKRSLAHPVDAL
jgi:hypothetical protein